VIIHDDILLVGNLSRLGKRVSYSRTIECKRDGMAGVSGLIVKSTSSEAVFIVSVFRGKASDKNSDKNSSVIIQIF